MYNSNSIDKTLNPKNELFIMFLDSAIIYIIVSMYVLMPFRYNGLKNAIETFFSLENARSQVFKIKWQSMPR